MKHSCEMMSAVSNGRARWKYVYCLLAVFLLLGSSSLCVSDTLYVPNYDPDVSNLSPVLNGGYPFTLFANNLYVNSFDGNINFVLPLNGSKSTPYAFNDTDYLMFTDPVTGQVIYSPSSSGIIYNIYDGNYYDATCGAGPCECSDAGFLQYLRDNCRICVGNTEYTGFDLYLVDFMDVVE